MNLRTRNLVIFTLGLLALSVVICFSASAGTSEKPASTVGSAKPNAVSAADVFDQLKAGNSRFAKGTSQFPRQNSARLAETASGQHPKAIILTCSDSRIPVEKVFDQGIGDLFVVRVAGNVADIDETGTIEYGAEHLGAPVLIVLGHTKCGAVTAVATHAEVEGSVPRLVDNIAPAVERAHKLNPTLEGKDLVPAATVENVWQSVEDLLGRSEIIRGLVIEGNLKVVGAIYNLETGTVDWLGSHPRQTALLASPKVPTADAGSTEKPATEAALPDISKIEAPDNITADLALGWLKDGNKRFTDEKPMHPNQSESYRASLVSAQHPFVTMLSCSDSRVPLEEIFDVGAGDIFAVRVAGNVADVDEVGSIEYGTGHLGTPLLIVLGHTSCGAVTAVATHAELGGSLPTLVDNIIPAVEQAAKEKPGVTGKDLVPAAIVANVWNSIDQLYSASPLVRALVKSGKLSVQGALYHLDNGSVEWLGERKVSPQLASTNEPAPAAKSNKIARFAPSTTVGNAPTEPSVVANPKDEPASSVVETKSESKSDSKQEPSVARNQVISNEKSTKPESSAVSKAQPTTDADLASLVADIEFLKSEIAKLKGQTAEANKMLASLDDITAAPATGLPGPSKLSEMITTLKQTLDQQKAATKPAVNATTAGHGTIQFSGFVHQQFYNKFGSSKATTFDSKRARLGLAGDVNNYARLDFVGEFAKSPKLLDGIFSLSPSKNWTIRMGQYKVPFSTDILRSPTAYPFVNLSLASGLGPDRDIGLSVRYGAKFSKSVNTDFIGGVFNGGGINASDANTNKNIALRAVTKIGSQWSIAPNWYFGKTNDTGALRQNLSTYGGSIGWSGKRDMVEAEYIGSTIGHTRKEGWYVHGGHTFSTGSKFLPEIQMVARYEQFNPSLAAVGDKTNRVTIGTNLFVDKKYTLIQFNYQLNGEEKNSVKNDEFLMNFQVAF